MRLIVRSEKRSLICNAGRTGGAGRWFRLMFGASTSLIARARIRCKQASFFYGSTTMASQQSGLSDEFITRQHTRLTAMRRELLGAGQGTIAAERRVQQERGSEAQEFEDDAQRMEQDVANQALRDVNDQRISDIERALQKIDEGTYGLSDESGVPIPKARLDAMPEALLTVEEQERREAGR
jgi:DnaK suppressor protein